MPSPLPFPTDLIQFVVWLGLNGLTIAALLEKFPQFQKLTAFQKSISVFILVVGAPFASEGLQAAVKSLDPAVLAQVQHYVDLAWLGLQGWAASQYGHSIVKVAFPNTGPLPPFKI